MATTAQLKTRVILQTSRDDMGSGGILEQALTDALAQAVEDWADTQFWFNRASGTGNTTANVATITMPSGIRVPAVVAYGTAYSGRKLERVDLETIETSTVTGQPTQWAENEGTIQLWPIPNGVYAIYVYGNDSAGVPASGSSNIWTTEAYDLIVATTCKRLYRDYFRDIEGATLAQAAEGEALAKLQRETRRRGRFGLKSDLPIIRRGSDLLYA
jgi:hypothetical protein